MADNAGSNPITNNKLLKAVTLTLALGTQSEAADANTATTPATPQDIENFQNTTRQLETEILNLSDVILDTLKSDIYRLNQSPSNNTELQNYTERVNALEEAIDPLQQQGADQTWDENTDIALTAFVTELQNGGLGYVLPDDTTLRSGWDRLRDGGYSMDYHAHLNDMLNVMDQGMRDIAERQNEGGSITQQDRQNFAQYQSAYNELSGFFYVMDDLKSQNFIEFAPNQPSDDQTIDYDQALTIMDTALKSVKDAQINYFNPGLGDDQFEMASRRATQALIIELSNDIGLENSDGKLTRQFRNTLGLAMRDEAHKQAIADKYLNGDMMMADRFIAAFNTVELNSPPILPRNEKQFISQDNLIYRPDFNETETQILQTSLAHVPSEELAAINQFSVIMTGYGMDNLLSDGALTAQQIDTMRGSDPAQAYSNLFQKSYAASDGTEDGITNQLVERFNAVYENMPAYSAYHKIQLRADLRDAAEAAKAAYDNTAGSAEEKLTAAGEAFATAMPQHENFVTQHGIGRRSIITLDQGGMNAMPQHIAGFSNSPNHTSDARPDNINESNLQTLDQALQAPTIETMTEQIRQSYDAAPFYEYVDNPGYIKTIGESYIAFNQSPKAQATWDSAQDSLHAIHSIVTNAYGERTEPAIIKSASGESFLASRDENDQVQIRFLNMADIDTSTSAIETLDIDNHLNMEDVLTQGAYATYQARNENDSDNISNEKITLFKIGDKSYVGGMNGQSGMFQIHEINPDFFNTENARLLSSARTQNTLREAYDTLKDADPAYAFVRENYNNIYDSGSNNDLIFDIMARFVGTPEAETARLLANTPASKPDTAPTEADEQAHLTARAEAVKNARPPEPRVNPGPYRGPNPEIDTIAFIMDKNPDNPDSLDSGVYVKVDSRINPLRNVEMSQSEISKLESALGINLDDQMQQAYGTPATNQHYHQQTSRYFILAIHPDHESLQGGLVIGFADDEGNTKYGFMPSETYDIRNHFDLSGKLQSQYLRPDNQGYDRLWVHPQKQGRIINNLSLKGMFVDTDNTITGPDRFDLVHAAMNRANWIGDGYHRPYAERLANGSQDHHTPHDSSGQPNAFRENANAVTNISDSLSNSTDTRQPHSGHPNPAR